MSPCGAVPLFPSYNGFIPSLLGLRAPTLLPQGRCGQHLPLVSGAAEGAGSSSFWNGTPGLDPFSASPCAPMWRQVLHLCAPHGMQALYALEANGTESQYSARGRGGPASITHAGSISTQCPAQPLPAFFGAGSASPTPSTCSAPHEREVLFTAPLQEQLSTPTQKNSTCIVCCPAPLWKSLATRAVAAPLPPLRDGVPATPAAVSSLERPHAWGFETLNK